MPTTQPKLRVAPPPRRTIAKQVKNFLDLPGCKFTETTLIIDRGLSFDHWERIGLVLRRAESGIQWWIGDWMAYGEHEYKEKYAQATDANDKTGINIDTLRNYQWVSEHVPPVMRITEVPWSFHQLVAALPPEDQRQWLNKAAERKAASEPYTFRELKKEIEKVERSKNFKLVHAVLEKIWERIQDVDLLAETISIIGMNTKTMRSRAVPITHRLREEFLRLNAKHLPGKNDLVFGITNNIRKSFQTACHRAQIKDFRFHDCRATAITRWIEAGIPDSIAGQIAGQSQPRTTFRYTRLSIETLKHAAGVFNHAALPLA